MTIKRIALYRLIALGVLLALYDALDWMPLRVAQRDAVQWFLDVTRHTTLICTCEGSPAIHAGEQVYYYTAECTYLDLFLVVAPLIWVFGGSLRGNIVRIGVAAVVIVGANVLRTWASVYFNVRGVDWFYAHDLPDYIIWWPTVVGVALLTLRRDFCDHWEPGFKTRVVEKKTGVRTSEAHTA